MTQENWEDRVAKGVQLFLENFENELKKAGFTLPEDFDAEETAKEATEGATNPDTDVANTIPSHESVRLLRLAEDAVRSGDNDAAAGYLAIVDRYNDLV